MTNKEYKIIIKTFENNVDFKILVCDKDGWWNDLQLAFATKKEKEKLMSIAEQFIDFVSTI